MVMVVKSLHNISNSEPSDHRTFKEEIKIKEYATLAIVGKFPNGIGVMEQLLKAETLSLTWADYCTMTPTDQLFGKRNWTLKIKLCFS